MLTFFLFICALPVLITLFVIGLRFFQELLPVLVVVVIAGGCMVSPALRGAGRVCKVGHS